MMRQFDSEGRPGAWWSWLGGSISGICLDTCAFGTPWNLEALPTGDWSWGGIPWKVVSSAPATGHNNQSLHVTFKSVQISPEQSEHQLPRGGRGKVMWLDPEDSSVPVGSVLRRCHAMPCHALAAINCGSSDFHRINNVKKVNESQHISTGYLFLSLAWPVLEPDAERSFSGDARNDANITSLAEILQPFAEVKW